MLSSPSNELADPPPPAMNYTVGSPFSPFLLTTTHTTRLMKKTRNLGPFPALAILAAAASIVSAQGPTDTLDRAVLPSIHEPKREPITTLDARDAKAPPRFEVKAPEGAPNVVIVLIDDIGFWRQQCLWRSDPDADPGEAWRRRA